VQTSVCPIATLKKVPVIVNSCFKPKFHGILLIGGKEMNSELPSSQPLEKMQSFAETRPSHLQALKKGDEGEWKSGLVPEADRVQLSERTQFSQGAMTQYLTSNRNLNAYIIMLQQVAELEDKTNDSPIYETLTKKSNQEKKEPDVFA
jgi:hypothetical protein